MASEPKLTWAAGGFVFDSKIKQTFCPANVQSKQNKDLSRTEATENPLEHLLASPAPANQLLLRRMPDTYSSSGKKAGNIFAR